MAAAAGTSSPTHPFGPLGHFLNNLEVAAFCLFELEVDHRAKLDVLADLARARLPLRDWQLVR